MTENAPPPQSQSLNLDQALQQAIACHQAGQLPDAERLYLAILDSQPNHADANHNLGVLSFQSNRTEAGLARFKAALEANPSHAQYWLSYIDALSQTGQSDAANQLLARGRQFGLQGEAVEALAARLQAAKPADSALQEKSPPAAGKSANAKSAKPEKSATSPTAQQIDSLVNLFGQGRFGEAAAIAETMTRQHPGHAFGWKALGAALTQMGQHADALAPMQKAAALSPFDSEAQSNLGVTLQFLGRLTEAEASYRRALKINPDVAQTHCKLGVTLRELGKLREAQSSLLRALQLKPDYSEAHSNLGIVLKDLGRLNEAEAACRRALEISPDFAEAHYNLGVIFQESGRLADAAASYRAALRARGNWIEAQNNLGNVLIDLGRLDEAETVFRLALQARPDWALAHCNLGNLLREAGRLDEAQRQLQQALQLDPDSPEAHNNLGNVFKDQERPDLAEACYRKALQLKPEYALAHGNLGIALKDQGRLAEADSSYKMALQLEPGYSEAYSNLLFLHGYNDLIEPGKYLELARGWERANLSEQERQAARLRVFKRAPLGGRRLRVGYVSGDFRRHAVSHFLERLFARHDRKRIELFAYSTSGQQDDVTQRLQRLSEHWLEVARSSDSDLRDRIESDRIDVLIDLSGHTRGHRLGVFARRAAPVQAHYLGFFASTGLTEMDYWIGDEILTPPASCVHFSERVWRLPRVWVSYDGRMDAPAPEWAPDADGAIRLGSFNHLGKLTPATLALWARLLQVIPEGKLLLKTRELALAGNRQRIVDSLAAHGIAPERILLEDRTKDWSEHMAHYHRIDIALDPVGGVGGGTTTCDALWMGVPVVTLAGERMGSRMSASMLDAIGRPEWIADSESGYVDRVAALARDPELRRKLRLSQRDRMAASALCDAGGLARELENAYFEMYARWVAGQA